MALWWQASVLITIFGLVSAQTKLNLNSYLQPNRVTLQQFQATSRSSNLCARNCVAGEDPKICYYKWVAESYDTMGPQCGNCPTNAADCNLPQCVVANGFEKSIITMNRMVPGPTIEVCLGDRIIIDIQNNIPGMEVSVHWHGLFQKGTQYMDGVPMVTQCAIHEGDTFRYDFIAQNEGTHYWHSHAGLQKLDGVQGSLIVRKPKSSDANGNAYDFDQTDHVLMISDWMNTTAEERFPGTSRREPGQLPITFLLNDRGRPKLAPGQQNAASQVPYKEVWIQQGRRYRFRFIGGMCTVCGVELSIESHDMTLIATDGAPVNPVTVKSIQLFSGERYDVVINANQRPGTFWIHMRGLAECAAPDEQIYQLGVLRYTGTNQARNDAPGYNSGFNRSPVLNPQNATCASGQGGICVSQLTGSIPDNDDVLENRPDFNFVFRFGFNPFLNPTNNFFNRGRYDRYLVAPDRTVLTSWMNNISFIQPPSPLISQGPDIPETMYCPLGRNNMPVCPTSEASKGYCECIHMIRIPLGANVQILVGDSSPVLDLHHPFHLHGYDFFVMAMDQLKNGESLDSVNQQLISRNFRRSSLPARKDTITVPSNGYAAVRFRANNPGLWFFHCHFMYHLATGMAVVLQVGEQTDWPGIPRNFPKCGNYLPDTVLEDYFVMRQRAGI